MLFLRWTFPVFSPSQISQSSAFGGPIDAHDSDELEHGMTDPLTVSVSSSRLAGGAGLEAARGCAAWGAKTGFWSAGTLSTDGGDRGGKGEQ